MSSTPAIRNVAIVGASGNIGSSITRALLNLPTPPTITAITRATSTATFPSSLKVAKGNLDDASFMLSTLQGQDVLILCLSFTVPIASQHHFIDLASRAGIKYIIPTEFGSDTNNAAITAAVPMMAAKKPVREYVESVRKKTGTGLKWIGVVNNPWTDYSLAHGMFGIDVRERRATLFVDEGVHVPFRTTTLAQAGRAVAALMALPASKLEKYENKLVYVSSFKVSGRELLEAVQRATGTDDGDWTVEVKTVQERREKGLRELEAGNPMGMVELLYAATMTRGLGDEYPGRKTMNEELDLPEESLDEWMKEFVARM